jgi:hypothetical protein
MTGRRGRAVRLVTAGLLLATAGCGGGSDADVAAQQLAQARTYASSVSAISQRTGTTLVAIADRADYRDAEAAAASTRAYAAAVRSAAADLGRATPPGKATQDHRALVALYRATATQMDALAAGFLKARSGRALAAKAQELSAVIHGYATRELELRQAIERALPAAASPTEGASRDSGATDPAVANGGPSDPG